VSSIPAGLRRQVRFRAGDHCEYCGLDQEGQEATFHIDHIVPTAFRGLTTVDNLARGGTRTASAAALIFTRHGDHGL
jgi:HNH endonuclease